MNDSWIRTAPKRLAPIVLGTVAKGDDFISPGVSMLFQGLKRDDDISVTVVASEFELRKFQKELDRAITSALKESRGER